MYASRVEVVVVEIRGSESIYVAIRNIKCASMVILEIDRVSIRKTQLKLSREYYINAL